MELSERKKAAEEAHAESLEMWSILEGWQISTADEYTECGNVLKEVRAKHKFLDEERKISVKPLNDEVKRVNDWFRPALDKLEQISSHVTKLMGAYTLRKREEEQRLLREAEQAARAVRATDSDATSQLMTIVNAAAKASQTASPTVQGISARQAWNFTVTDPQALVRAHPELAMPDMKAIAAWVKEHGDKRVPRGVEVQPDVRFTVRQG